MVVTETKKTPAPVKPRLYMDLDDPQPAHHDFEFSETTIFLLMLAAGLAGLVWLFLAR